jgi:hypothetical protein
MNTMNTFTLSSENEKSIKDLMKQTKPNQELEVRFGNYIYNRETRKNNFQSDCEIDFFYNLKKSFDNSPNVNRTFKHTIETIYSNHIKKILDVPSNTTTYIKKTSVSKYNIYDYNFRLSLANELAVSGLEDANENDYIMKREKSRTSYTFGLCRVDLTIVKETNTIGVTSTKYEVELEVLGAYSDQLYASTKNIITVILQTRQQNFYVISNYQKRQIINEYKSLMNTYYFVGAQPETLQKNGISNLYKSRYSVTDKADGDRMMLFIASDSYVYFIDNNLQKIYRTMLKSIKYSRSIVDGELVNINSKIHYLGFDIMAFNGVDIRGNTDYMLESRLNVMTDIIESIQNTGDKYCITPKKFYFKNVFLGAERILDTIDEKPYDNDGLIFTPMDEPYPLTRKCPKLLKWKPSELNTIDFYSVKVNDNEWELYVQQHVKKTDDTQTSTNNLVLFDVSKLCRNPVAVDNLMFKTSFDSSCIDPSTDEPYKSNTVIEYKWNSSLSKFVPLRTRWDKTANPKKHGNFSTVACDIWNNIHNPVEREHLFRFTVLSSAKEDYVFERMRKFHNKVKESLYNTYCKNTNSLLELCSGRGGDMHKWVYNNIKTVVGYDISEKSIEECIKRMTQINNHATNITVHQLDLCNPDAPTTIKQNNQEGFDNVCCQFGVHYFFKSHDTFKTLLQILDNSLNNNGHFIVTFMDNKKLEHLMGNKTELSKEINNEVVYYLKNTGNATSDFGNRLRISLSGNSILSEGSDEYIINFEEFVDTMKYNGYNVVETSLFESMQGADLVSELERDISFLNRYCVFQKCKTSNVDAPLQLEEHVINHVSFDFDTINLNKQITVTKVSTKYDILDILNCIDYKYYKNLHENSNITTFDDIVQLFREYRVTLNPYYVPNPIEFTNYLEDANNIYFCYHKHVVEKHDSQEVTEYDNWYIILYNDQLLFEKPNLVEQAVDEDDKTKRAILEDLSKNKITVKLLKEHLQTLSLKTTGNKEDLHKRLLDFIEKK